MGKVDYGLKSSEQGSIKFGREHRGGPVRPLRRGALEDDFAVQKTTALLSAKRVSSTRWRRRTVYRAFGTWGDE